MPDSDLGEFELAQEARDRNPSLNVPYTAGEICEKKTLSRRLYSDVDRRQRTALLGGRQSLTGSNSVKI